MGEPDNYESGPPGSGSGFIRKAPFGEWTEVSPVPYESCCQATSWRCRG